MKEIDAVFDEAVDGFTPIAEGTYPAHCNEFQVNDWKDSKIFNLTFTVAEEAKTLKIPKMVSDGNGGYIQQADDDGPITISGAYMAGKKFKNNGVWLTPKPQAGESWKNRRYKEFFEALGVDFPSDKGKVTLAKLEESPVIGLNCLSLYFI